MRPRAHPGGSGSSSAVAPQDVISLVSAIFGSCSWARDVFLHVPALKHVFVRILRVLVVCYGLFIS